MQIGGWDWLKWLRLGVAAGPGAKVRIVSSRATSIRNKIR